MNKKPRLILFVVIIVMSLILAFYLGVKQVKSTLGASFEPLFTVLGTAPKSVDRLLSRIIPVNDLDEAAIGDALKDKLKEKMVASKYQRYLDSLIAEISRFKKKPFTYDIFVVAGEPNAFAMPGGVLGITTDLLESLKDEAALVAVLGHEIAHVELNHCFDNYRFAAASEKFSGKNFGFILDRVYLLMTQSSFSKTQETEADQYGFNLLKRLQYDPAGSARSFQAIADYYKSDSPKKKLRPLRSFFRSHPSAELRISKFDELAKREFSKNSKRYYVGKKNYQEKVTKFESSFEVEWARGTLDSEL